MEKLKNLLIWERGLEFLAEDLKRYFDFVRMKDPNGDIMYMYQINVFLPTIPSGTPDYRGGQWIAATKTDAPFIYFTRKNLLLPIPKSELDDNPNFGPQNPGW